MNKIKYDLLAFSNGNSSIWKKIGIILTNPCFHSVMLFRFSCWCYRIRLLPFAKMVWYINRLLFHVDLDYHAKIAGGLRIVHGLGVVIGKNVISKGYLTVYQGVTIGGNGKKRCIDNEIFDMPIIGENCVFYTDAKVFGPIIIDDDIEIKAGCIISRDVRKT